MIEIFLALAVIGLGAGFFWVVRESFFADADDDRYPKQEGLK